MRESGILMPVSSLPGPYGIGCFGAEALNFKLIETAEYHFD